MIYDGIISLEFNSCSGLNSLEICVCFLTINNVVEINIINSQSLLTSLSLIPLLMDGDLIRTLINSVIRYFTIK